MKNSLAFALINESKSLIHSDDFMLRHRLSEKFFTRKRKMQFSHVVFFLLNFLTLSLQVELLNFNRAFIKKSIAITKSGFSRARKKISYLAFKELADLSAKPWLSAPIGKTFKNHRLFAIDGSIIHLPHTNNRLDLIEFFSAMGADFTAPRARASILCDVFNGVVVHSELSNIKTSERELAAYVKIESDKIISRQQALKKG